MSTKFGDFMEQLSNISVIKDLLQRYNFNFSKSLGQNFIVNPSICPRMVELSEIDETYLAIEIGTGIGVLTTELAKRAKKVVAVEVDKKLLPLLDETLSEFDNITVLNQDILKTDLNKIIDTYRKGLKVCVVANLPYYITSPILMYLLEGGFPIEFITVMVQKEAAQRLCALPGSRQSGAITLAVHYYSNPELLFHVTKGSFMPAPKVDSAVIKLQVKKQPDFFIEDKTFFFQVVKAAFGQRRKTIYNALSHGLGLSKELVGSAIEKSGLANTLRAENLTLEQFCHLSNNLFNGKKESAV